MPNTIDPDTIKPDSIWSTLPVRAFVDRDRELASLEHFWDSSRAQFVPMIGRRRVGKTYLAEHFAANKRVAYFRCRLAPTSEQLPTFGATLAELADDEVLRAEPPSTWPGAFAVIARLAREARLLLILDEL